MANDDKRMQDDIFEQDEGFLDDQFLSQFQNMEDSSDDMDYLNDFFKDDNSLLKEEDNSLEGILTGIDNSDMMEEEEQPEDDFMSLLSQLNPEDPVAEDIHAINEMLYGKDPGSLTKDSAPSDVGDVFSEALKAVNSLDDLASLESLVDFENLIPEAEPLKVAKEKKKKEKIKKEKIKKEKIKKEKIKKETTKKVKTLKKQPEEVSKVSKRGLFQRLSQLKSTGDTSQVNTMVDQGAMKAVEEKATALPAKKKQKAKPAKKKSKLIANKSDSERTSTGESKEKIVKAKKEPKIKKTKRLKPSNPKKERIVIIEDVTEDNGRISPVGASIVFVLFGALVIVLLLCTNWVSYTLSIHNAQSYFDKNRYTQAYNEVYGMDIKDEDIELYDKIRTVMYVNKQLNSYNNYYAMEKYPEALDALLKGLSRYDKYIELATYLGIDSDLNYVRDKILSELKDIYNLSPKKAVKIIKSDTQTEYSLAIYDIVKENMKN